MRQHRSSSYRKKSPPLLIISISTTILSRKWCWWRAGNVCTKGFAIATSKYISFSADFLTVKFDTFLTEPQERWRCNTPEWLMTVWFWTVSVSNLNFFILFFILLYFLWYLAVISKEDVTRGSYYKPEDFVMLECAMKNKSHVLSLNFGFVQSCRRSLVSNGVRHSINRTSDSTVYNGCSIISYGYVASGYHLSKKHMS